MSSKGAATKQLIELALIRGDLTDQASSLIEGTLAKSKASATPKLIHLCGIPGAGKTTYTNFFLKQNEQYALVQFDSVMEQLPGYRNALELSGPAKAFSEFELPARVIGYHLLQALVDNRRDIFFDHGALNRQHLELLKVASEIGYIVEMHYIECSLSQAIDRIEKREKSKGRHTPRTIVSERHELLHELLPLYKELVHKFEEIEPTLYLTADQDICTPFANKEECIE